MNWAWALSLSYSLRRAGLDYRRRFRTPLAELMHEMLRANPKQGSRELDSTLNALSGSATCIILAMDEPKQPPFIHPTALVETEAIGEGTRIWAFAHVLKNAVIGNNCNIGDHAFIESGVTIGNNVTIKNGVCIWQHVHVADNVFLGPNSVLTNDLTPRSRNTNWVPIETWIEEGATIGANATIVCGVRLGRRCLVGAGAVVTHDVGPYELVYGNPARHGGWVCFCAQSLRRVNEPIIACERCGRRYTLVETALEPVP